MKKNIKYYILAIIVIGICAISFYDTDLVYYAGTYTSSTVGSTVTSSDYLQCPSGISSCQVYYYDKQHKLLDSDYISGGSTKQVKSTPFSTWKVYDKATGGGWYGINFFVLEATGTVDNTINFDVRCSDAIKNTTITCDIYHDLELYNSSSNRSYPGRIYLDFATTNVTDFQITGSDKYNYVASGKYFSRNYSSTDTTNKLGTISFKSSSDTVKIELKDLKLASWVQPYDDGADATFATKSGVNKTITLNLKNPTDSNEEEAEPDIGPGEDITTTTTKKVEVNTTKKNDTKETTTKAKEEKVENVKTGVFDYLWVIPFIGLLGYLSINKINKNRKFNKI